MKETTIEMENAGSGLPGWVVRARRGQTMTVVLDAALPLARLAPTPAPRCTGAEFARALAATRLLRSRSQRSLCEESENLLGSEWLRPPCQTGFRCVSRRMGVKYPG
jgi:hypothetical protein